MSCFVLYKDCKLIIKATKVDGIYNKDPIKNKNAKLNKIVFYYMYFLKFFDPTI